MAILFLTNENAKNFEKIVDKLKETDTNVIIKFDRVNIDFIKNNKIDFIVSDRYAVILEKKLLDYLDGNVINTHPSILPLNRGWQPNFFSILYNDPTGVTIHQVDEGLDTGNIILQKKIFYDPHMTLRQTYTIFRKTIENLLINNFDQIYNGKLEKHPQKSKGSFNSKAKFEKIFMKFHKGWDTKIIDIKNKIKN